MDAKLTTSINNNDTKVIKSEQTQMNESDYQHLLRISNEKQRQQIQEVIDDVNLMRTE